MSRTIFKNANLLDGNNPARNGIQIVIDGERIIEVTDADVQAGADDRVVDLAGKTVMPGMVSCHYHASYNNITIQPEPLGVEKPAGYLTLVGAKNVALALQAGITGIVSAGANAGDIDAQLKLAIDDGIIDGPRILAGSRGLDSHGGYTDTENWWWELGNKGAQRFADGPDEFRKVVRDEIKRGADVIKIFPSGGHGVPDSSVAMGITRDELNAVVDAAHQRGKMVRAHCAWKHVILECVRAGVDIIDHGDQIDAECIAAMKEAGTTLVPSMYFVSKLLSDTALLAGATEEQMAPVQADFDNIRKMLPQAIEAGLRIVLGDDFGIIILPHGSYAGELEFYVKSVGVAPLEVIRWATKNGAELMGMGDRLGTVEPGKLADLVVVGGDPTVDIAVLQDPSKVLAVLKGGDFKRDLL